MDEYEPSRPLQYQCPACGQIIEGDPSRPAPHCPVCGQQLAAAGDLESCSEYVPEPVSGEDQADVSPAHREVELSELRIRQIANLRRGAYRSRSWCIIAAVVALVGAARLVEMMVVNVRWGLRIVAIGEGLAAVAALMICGYFLRRTIDLTREIRNTRLEDPAHPPDLSTLSDGSQRWSNLENVTDDSS